MANSVIQHPLRELVDRILALQSEPGFFAPEIAAQEVFAQGRDKVFAFANLVKTQVENTPAIYVSSAGLNQIHAVLQNVFNEMSGFLSTTNTGHISNAVAQVEQNLAPLVWTFGWSSTLAGNISSSAVALDTFEQSANAAAAHLSAQRLSLEGAIEVLKRDVASQEARLSEMTSTIATQKADAALVVATVTKEYAESETKRSTDFKTMLTGMESDFSGFASSQRVGASALIAKLEGHQTEAQRIVQVVGNIGVTGNFQKIAQIESDQAKVWRRITLGIFSLGVLLAVLTFLKFYFEPYHPDAASSVLIRLLFAIAITAPAGYTALESARHRTNSDRARQTELELASLGPFIELMPDDKKFAIREELTKKYFGNKVDDHKADTFMGAKDVKDLLIEAIKALTPKK